MNETSTAEPLNAALARLRATLAERRHRALLWLDGPLDRVMARALSIWQGADWSAPLWLGPDSEATRAAGSPPLPARQARSRLGGEHDLVVVDALSPGAGFDPDAFGALAGTVRAGGLLVLLTPEAWRDGVPLPDADYARLAAWPHRPEALSARHLARIARRLAASPWVLHWPATAPAPALVLPDAEAPAAAANASDDCLTHDQAAAVRRLTRLRRRRPLVLSADRGRGKSSALGIAAARRLQAGEREIWLTAPRAAALEPVFVRLGEALPEGRRETHAFHVELAHGPATVRFLPPDALCEALAGSDIDPRSPPTLFVDEAAAIPAPLLGRWLAAFPRIAFATTVHGYEGTGRGFDLRFRARLDSETPDWRACRLEQPVRWGEGDPLEALTRELLLLDAEPADDAAVGAALDARPLGYRQLDRQALADDERGLGELFGLLVQAHYRTTPGDLRQLLDGPELTLIAAYAGAHCVGVCVGQREGGFPPALAEAIHYGRRRPRGHLLAQSLAAHGGFYAAAEARWCRVLRVAVHPAARRRGIGSALVEQLATSAREAGDDYLGTSFGAEPGLIAFWRAQRLVPLRLGLSREASSGEHALMMGRALRADAKDALREWRASFATLLPSLLNAELDALDAAVAAALLEETLLETDEALAVDDETLARLAWFAAGGGELALVRPWLARVWRAGRVSAPEALAEADWLALVAPLFQGREPAAGGRLGGAQGRKARLTYCRALAGRLHAALGGGPLGAGAARSEAGNADRAGHVGNRRAAAQQGEGGEAGEQ
ncbi:GNAT family N-acetyltransferase [Halomonas sp. HP20-15]|uniref:tRNA(Met) cytidine acetyltransferase TmcA n=1 Tax=Halomonas sp. HP20-15 TaxID=3085901 RepID=UPI002980E9BD|nr:GNAT family N-acetyltransferase [Halomonas sp. HP20-15]MDW5378353.1 GNAT family N-acetyltransferase [Halomonas sp. HP20-15]